MNIFYGDKTENGVGWIFSKNIDYDILYGKGGSDYLTSFVPGAVYYGGRGSDTLIFNPEKDGVIGSVMYGEKGPDWLVSLYEVNDVMYGGKGPDTIFGGEGDDVLKGGKGKDRLYPEEGSDVIKGGRGRDIFNFTVFIDNKDNRDLDIVTDFNPKKDQLKIGLDTFDQGPPQKFYWDVEFGEEAVDDDDYFVYNDGVLYFDDDANGPNEKHPVIIFQNNPDLTPENFGLWYL